MLDEQPAKTPGWGVNALLALALLLLFWGVWAPLLTLQKFFIFNNSVSLLSALGQLWRQGEWLLFGLIGGFSVMLPLAKLVILATVWNLDGDDTARHRRHLEWLETYGKWSMLDVFVVALLVVSVKLGALAEVRVEYGIYPFAASVLLTMGLSRWIARFR